MLYAPSDFPLSGAAISWTRYRPKRFVVSRVVRAKLDTHTAAKRDMNPLEKKGRASLVMKLKEVTKRPSAGVVMSFSPRARPPKAAIEMMTRVERKPSVSMAP